MVYNHQATMRGMYSSNSKHAGNSHSSVGIKHYNNDIVSNDVDKTIHNIEFDEIEQSEVSIRKSYLEEKGFSREAGQAAILANSIYKPQTDGQDTPDGYTKDRDLSNRRSKVYTDANNDVWLVFRGTDPTNLNDIGSDIYIGAGMEEQSDRFRESEEHFLKVKEKYGDRKIYVTGHSLGGSLAHYVGMRNDNAETYTFNKGATPWSEKERFDLISKSKQYHYRTWNDLVSAGNPSAHDGSGKKQNEEFHMIRSKKGLLPLSQGHSMENFIHTDDIPTKSKKGTDLNFV